MIKEDAIKFVNENKGKKIEIHYENNFIDRWGDDDFFTYDTSLKKHYDEILDTINDCYIHGIKLISYT